MLGKLRTKILCLSFAVSAFLPPHNHAAHQAMYLRGERRWFNVTTKADPMNDSSRQKQSSWEQLSSRNDKTEPTVGIDNNNTVWSFPNRSIPRRKFHKYEENATIHRALLHESCPPRIQYPGNASSNQEAASLWLDSIRHNIELDFIEANSSITGQSKAMLDLMPFYNRTFGYLWQQWLSDDKIVADHAVTHLNVTYPGPSPCLQIFVDHERSFVQTANNSTQK